MNLQGRYFSFVRLPSFFLLNSLVEMDNSFSFTMKMACLDLAFAENGRPYHSVCRFIKIQHSGDRLSFPWDLVEGNLSIRSINFYYSNRRQPFNLSNVWVWGTSTITGLAASIYGSLCQNLSRCTPVIYRHENSRMFKCTSSLSRV